MEKLEGPGISIALICLTKSNIAVGNPQAAQKYNLRLVGFGREISADTNHLDILAAFDLMFGISDPIFKFTCEFLARYQRVGEGGLPWDQFSPAMALAHVVPYLREFVSNTTNRLPVPVLMLPPINTYQMFADYEERLRKPGQAVLETGPEK